MKLQDFRAFNVLFQMVAFGFTATVGGFGLKPIMTSGSFALLIGATLILTIIAWFFAAQQNQQRRIANIDNAELRNILDQIRLVNSPPPLDSAVANLMSMPNSELRARTSRLAKAMRHFEASVMAQQQEGFYLNREGMSEEQQQAQWDANLKASIALSRNSSREFSNRFAPDARACLDELRGRLGIPKPQASSIDIAIDYGALAGPQPMSEIASHLEQLARKLAD